MAKTIFARAGVRNYFGTSFSPSQQLFLRGTFFTSQLTPHSALRCFFTNGQNLVEATPAPNEITADRTKISKFLNISRRTPQRKGIE